MGMANGAPSGWPLEMILNSGKCITELGKKAKLAKVLAYIRSAPTVKSLLCDKIKKSKRRRVLRV